MAPGPGLVDKDEVLLLVDIAHAASLKLLFLLSLGHRSSCLVSSKPLNLQKRRDRSGSPISGVCGLENPAHVHRSQTFELFRISDLRWNGRGNGIFFEWGRSERVHLCAQSFKRDRF